jgi:Spy/CpxP family protein refolding chaperone
MSPNLDSRDRSRILALAILVAVFAAGALGGAALTVAMDRGEDRGPGHEERILYAQPILKGLDLTPAQRERVGRLMDDQRRKAEFLMADTEPRIKALVDSTNAAIEQILTPQQREEFRQMQEHGREDIVRQFR